ncbi:hypothetical protein [Nocardia sp. NPDC003963]
MTADTELSDKIIDAVAATPELRPAAPIICEHAGWWPLDPRRYAVGLSATVVEVRVVATGLPLAPLLDSLAAAIRPLLPGTRWESAELRLVVTELDATALTIGGDPDHSIGA